MAEVIPAVMPKNLTDLEHHVERVLGTVNTIQIDVMDGKFVQPRTWPYSKHDDFFEEILREEKGLPFWNDIDYEIDLMVENPEREAETWISAGAKRIIAHIEGIHDIEKILSLGNEFIEVGLAIGTDTPIEKIAPHLHDIDFVQCMGIAKIGYQGQPFDERVLSHIAQLRALDAELPISVDGGVSFETAPRLLEAGADILVSGSLVFTAENPADVIHRLASL
jgi:ribulose-phosphate 3-epimerase